MNQKTIEYAVIKSTVNILCVLCAAHSNAVIDALTGVLWDEEEAGEIKASSGKFEIG
jgi:hypothetical protein